MINNKYVSDNIIIYNFKLLVSINYRYYYDYNWVDHYFNIVTYLHDIFFK
jgi:hypothetical protein